MTIDPSFVGLVYAFFAGLLFAVSDILIRIASRGISPSLNVAISLGVGIPLLYAVSLIRGEEILSLRLLLGFALIGVFHFVLGRLLFYIAVAGMGASTASILTSPTLLISSLLAWLFLGESLGVYTIASIALISTAIYLSASRPSGSRLWVARRTAIIAGLSSSLVFSITAVSIRYLGIEGDSPVMGAAVSYTAAFPVAVLLSMRDLNQGRVKAGAGVRAFVVYSVLGGLVVAAAQMFRYMALDSVPVAHALILISLFPIHTTILSALSSRVSGEHIEARHLLAAILGFAGVALLIYFEY